MLIVLADDFSGAAEIGGIGHRFGLNTEIQLEFDPGVEEDLLVVDTNTRSMKETDAVRKLKEVVSNLQRSRRNFRLFKKVDSVMRGHLVAEINVLQSMMGYDRVLLLPANPEKGRKIVSGHYEMDGIRLNKTVFASDPDFPVHSSSISDMLGSVHSNLPHIHAKTQLGLPSSALITTDIDSKTDLKKCLQHANENDLCCGAAACFEAYLENMALSGNKAGRKIQSEADDTYKLIINGSTVKSDSEKTMFKKLGIPQLSLPGFWEGGLFVLDSETEGQWNKAVTDLLQSHPVVAVSIDHPVKPFEGISSVFSNHLIKLMRFVRKENGKKRLHFALTGGATAYELIQSTGMSKFHVQQEVSPGVVTLKGREDEEILFTVKPGSYAWPVDFLKRN